jgi:AraC-like DNA-binding protein
MTGQRESETMESLRRFVLARGECEGNIPSGFPSLCGYRRNTPSAFEKGSALGVTLGVVIQGSKRVRLAGREFTIDPSRFFVLTREVFHESSTLDASPEQPFLALALSFSPEQVARGLLELSEAGGHTAYEDVPAFVMPFDPAIAGALERLTSVVDDPVGRRVLAPLFVEEILFRLLRSEAAAVVRNAVSPPDAGRILDAMAFIRSNAGHALSVERIARHVAMSPSHFAHRFRAVARVSPMRYLRDLRLEQARTLLLGNGYRAGEVASRVGFESPSHFTREFKRRFGVPPSHYLRQFPER